MIKDTHLMFNTTRLSDGERDEMTKLGMLTEECNMKPYILPKEHEERPPIKKWAVRAPGVLNEAFDYFPKPSSFSRGLCFDINDFKVLLISGTASVDENGKTIHVGDFRAQCWRTYRNITEILEAEKMTWYDIIRTTCYLRDIERDYNDFNEVRTAFFHWFALDPLPASTGIQARLCREDLLVEIEAIAICRSNLR